MVFLESGKMYMMW